MYQRLFKKLAKAYTPCNFTLLALYTGYKLECFWVKAEFMQSTVQCFFMFFLAIIVEWCLGLTLERNLHWVFLILSTASRTQAKTNKCKDSENDSVTLQPRKKVHILGAENVHELSTILCTGKLETLKFTDQLEYAAFTQTGSLFSKHQVSMKAK